MKDSELKNKEMFSKVTPEEARKWFKEKKSRALKSKVMGISEAIKKYVHNGDYLSTGGFGHIRIPMAALYEIVKQEINNLSVSAHTAIHDVDILLAGNCVKNVDVSYFTGYELRPLYSKLGSRLVKEGAINVVDWSNAALAWRFKAASMGISFMPTKTMLGTDTFKVSGAKLVECPFTGEKYCAVPALFPDVAIIHVHRCDMYGNSQIDGITVSDYDVARAAKRLIISTEKLIDTEEIRNNPERTIIPYFLVDAVVEAPYGSHPGEMPYLYYFDEEHIAEYLKATQDETGEKLKTYLEKYVFGVNNFTEYFELIGGENKMKLLEKIEKQEIKPSYLWEK